VNTATEISSCNTLYDVVSEALALNQINIKKYLPSYLISAKRVWQELFWNTFFVANSVWKTVQAGDPYPYVELDRDCERLLYVGIEDHCGDIQPIFYNNVMNVVPKPHHKKCGCESCECSGLCEDLNSTTFTTNVLFTINGIDYVEKIWLKYSPNGDVLEYKETPVKQYNSMTGDGGDFNNDYNNDYSTGGNGLGNFSIVTKVSQRKLCALKTYPCGCPQEIPENEELVRQHCGCFLPFFGHRRREHCEHFLSDYNLSEYGEVKLSPCATKIYFKPGRKRHHRGEKKIPDFLLVTYQTNSNPTSLSDQVHVPDFAKVALWSGMFYYIKKFNPKYSMGERQEAKWDYESEIDKVIRYLNPVSFQDLSDIGDKKIRW
jgi:hypothetical protein